MYFPINVVSPVKINKSFFFVALNEVIVVVEIKRKYKAM